MEIPEDVRQLASTGRKIEAVKRLCEQTGLSLSRAKQIVDRLATGGGPEPTSSTALHARGTVHYPNLAFAGFLFGILSASVGVYTSLMAAKTWSWVGTQGAILESKVVFAHDGALSPSIRYEYTVTGKKYAGRRVAYRGYTEGMARRWVRKYRKGQRVSIYYDPTRPSYAVLERGGSQWIVLFFAVGLGGIAVGFWAKKKANEARA